MKRLLLLIAVITAVDAAGRMCPLPDFPNGRLVILGQRLSDNYVLARSFAVVNCNPGFALTNGAAVSKCEDDGTWGAKLGMCAPPQQKNTDCTKNLVIENGHLVETNQPQNYKIECEDGYELNGASTIYCFDDRSWTLPGQCRPIPEDEIAVEQHQISQLNSQCFTPENQPGMLSINGGRQFLPYRFSVPPGTRVRLTCSPGYVNFGGVVESVCVGGVMWSPQPLSCIPQPRETTPLPPPPTTPRRRIAVEYLDQVRCELPPTSTGRYMTTGSGVFINDDFVRPGVSVTLKCNPLFEVRGGSGTASCQVDGSWANSIGSCFPMRLQNNYATSRRCYVAKPPNGSILMNGLEPVENDLYQVFSGTHITLQCLPGFEVTGGPVDTYCQDSGELVPLMGRCTQIATTTTTRKPTTTTTVDWFFAPKIQQDNTNVLCPVTQPRFGSLVLDRLDRKRSLPTPSENKVAVGTQVTLRCYIGYIANGPTTAYCGSNGALTNQLGECRAIIQPPSNPWPNFFSPLMNDVPNVRQQPSLPSTSAPSPINNLIAAVPRTAPEKTLPAAIGNLDNSMALINAAKGGDLAAIDFLLGNGANKNAHDTEGRTALMWASSLGNLEMTKLLVERGADPNIIDSKGYSPLLFAIHNGRFTVARYLADQKADVNVKAKNGNTALILAVQSNSPAIVQMLLLKDVDVDDFDSNGVTALIWAARKNSRVIVDLLLKYGADVDAADYDGMTVLMVAAKNGNNEIIQRLLENGVDVQARDINGLTAVMHADMNGHVNTVPLLQRRTNLYNVRFDDHIGIAKRRS